MRCQRGRTCRCRRDHPIPTAAAHGASRSSKRVPPITHPADPRTIDDLTASWPPDHNHTCGSLHHRPYPKISGPSVRVPGPVVGVDREGTVSHPDRNPTTGAPAPRKSWASSPKRSSGDWTPPSCWPRNARPADAAATRKKPAAGVFLARGTRDLPPDPAAGCNAVLQRSHASAPAVSQEPRGGHCPASRPDMISLHQASSGLGSGQYTTGFCSAGGDGGV